MRIAFTHNLRLTDSEDEAEFDTRRDRRRDRRRACARAATRSRRSRSPDPRRDLAARIEAFGPDLIFNTAEGRRGRAREAFYPALFEELGFPYTGSDAYVLTVTLDKWLTKLVLAQHGIDTPRARLVTPDEYRRLREPGALGLALPVIVKPNYEGSSKGIADDAVVRDARALAEVAAARARAPTRPACWSRSSSPARDVTVPFLEGRGDEGVLLPVDYLVDPTAREPLQPLRLPARSRRRRARCRCAARPTCRATWWRGCARCRRRRCARSASAISAASTSASARTGGSTCSRSTRCRRWSRAPALFAAAAREGLDYAETLHAVVESAARAPGPGRQAGRAPTARRADPLRIGFTFNVKRVDPKAGDDAEAEYDAPETIDAIREALASYGHDVTLFEATAELPRQLMQTPVDLVFNIAEGVAGRNREAQVPALCELLGIPYTGSDAATLSIALDKALSKRVLLQHGILTAEFQVMETGRERLSPKLKFPLIVKPNQEGSSKGVSAHASVVDDEAELRAVVRELHRPVPAAGAGRGVHPGARVHGGPARRPAAARAAADGDPASRTRPTPGPSTTTRSSRSGRSTSPTSARRS